MNLRFIFCILLLSNMIASAQTDSSAIDTSLSEEPVFVKPPLNEELKVGVKLGSGVSTLLGNELQNPTLRYMLSGGAYLRYRFNKHWSIQPEANITFRGSNFNNTAPGEYESIVMYCIDVPLLLMYGLNQKNTQNIVVGAQFSTILNSSIYLANALIAEPTSPSLNKNDLMLVLGSQFHTPFVGFQLVAKYGLININNGLLPNIKPPNSGKDIHQFVVEINFLF